MFNWRERGGGGGGSGRRHARWTLVLAAAALLGSHASSQASAQATYPGIGRPATAQEIAAWDIDVRPDFKGLPVGSGSAVQGQVIWEAQCASCHGVFGEANDVFSPLVGGTTAADIKTGRVARLNDAAYPGRTTLMKVATLSTLWDYIHRAMPWTAPKSLSPDEVFAVTAYLLNLGGVVPDAFVLSDRNMAATQQLMPNRNGMTTAHGLWPSGSLGQRPGQRPSDGNKPDVKAVACMKDCGPEPTVASFLPDFARSSHGNLAQQQRTVGPQRGADTSAPGVRAANDAAAPSASTASTASTALDLTRKHNCLVCHGLTHPVVGPALRDVAGKHAYRNDVEGYLAGKIKSGGQGVWGPVAMPAQNLSEADARAIARWLSGGAMP